jgi:signal transduction histidine kinase
MSPKVQISSIEVMGIPVKTDSVLKLPQLSLEHNKNAFKVFLATLNYKDVHPVFYMLEGIDKEWKKAGKTNVIEYNYLPPGKYVLKATCFEENGKHGEITAINIYIAAPFYNTWWFYSLVALTIVGLLYWFDRERTKRKEAVQKTRSNIAGQLHEEINTALNNINILSEMARLKAESEPEKAVQFIEQIHGRSHNMIIAMDDMLWSIAPENDSMSKAVDRMSEYIDALNNRHGIKIEMQADEKLNSLKPDMQLRHEAFLLFKDSIKSLVDAGVQQLSDTPEYREIPVTL